VQLIAPCGAHRAKWHLGSVSVAGARAIARLSATDKSAGAVDETARGRGRGEGRMLSWN